MESNGIKTNPRKLHHFSSSRLKRSSHPPSLSSITPSVRSPPHDQPTPQHSPSFAPQQHPQAHRPTTSQLPARPSTPPVSNPYILDSQPSIGKAVYARSEAVDSSANISVGEAEEARRIQMRPIRVRGAPLVAHV